MPRQLTLICCGDVSNVYPAKMLCLLRLDALTGIGGDCTHYVLACQRHCSIDGRAGPELLVMLSLGALDEMSVVCLGCCLTIVT